MKYTYLLKKILTNRVMKFMLLRYMVYFISFVSSFIIANKLGVSFMGTWGVVLLIWNYFAIFNFGIPMTSSLSLSESYNDIKQRNEYEKAGFMLTLGLSLLPLLLFFSKYFGNSDYMIKYNLNDIWLLITVIITLTCVNNYFGIVYRVKGKLFEYAVRQMLIHLIVFVVIFFFTEQSLLYALLYSYLVGNIVILLLFLSRGSLNFSGKLYFSTIKKMLKRSWLIFVYNICFYLIVVSVRSVISIKYSVEEFGMFSFSYTIAMSVGLLLETFALLITPKLIYLLSNSDEDKSIGIVHKLRINYVYASYLMMFVVAVFFPFIPYIAPKYVGIQYIVTMLAMTELLYANSFGYISLLMAKHQEKSLAICSVIALILNSVLLLFCSFFSLPYWVLLFAPIITYIVYALLLVRSGTKYLGITFSFGDIIKEVYPIRLMIPFASLGIVAFFNISFLYSIPLVLFILLNHNVVRELWNTVIKIINNPNIIDIKT